MTKHEPTLRELLDEVGEVPGGWAARCECYEGHNSASGRCNVRDVADPTALPGKPVRCERCRRECGGGK